MKAGNSAPNSIVKFDGTTGQSQALYAPSAPSDLYPLMALSTDGTIFTIETTQNSASVIGIDPAGGRKFSVPVPHSQYIASSQVAAQVQRLIVAGDGYAYLSYAWAEPFQGNPPVPPAILHLGLLRVNSSGASDSSDVYTVPTTIAGNGPIPIFSNMITNADTGVLLSFTVTDVIEPPLHTHVVITTGTSVSQMSTVAIGGQVGELVSVLQAQDGSFVGSVQTGDPNDPQFDTVAFDATGNMRWSVPNEQPQIATADGGVIGKSGITYDQNGIADGQINLATQSWRGNMYQKGSIIRVALLPSLMAQTLWAQDGASPSGNSTASRPWWFRLTFQNDFTFTPANPTLLPNRPCLKTLPYRNVWA